MNRALPQIRESVEELTALLAATTDRDMYRRVQAIYLAQAGLGRSRVEIAKMVAVSHKTVENWFIRYESGGLASLVTHRRLQKCGAKPHLNADMTHALNERLHTPEGFKSYQQACQWVKEKFGLDIPYKTMHGIIHYRLKAAPKAPRPCNVRQDEAEKKRLPNLALRRN